MDFPHIISSKRNRPNPKGKTKHKAGFSGVPIVQAAVGADAWTRVLNSPLGVVASFRQLNFNWNGNLVHRYLLSNQLVCEKEHELWFLIRGQPARFSLFEFEDITALNCDDLPLEIQLEQTEEQLRFHRLFKLPESCLSPCRVVIENLCQNYASEIRKWSEDDRVRLCYLAILSNGLLADNGPIPVDLYRLVGNLYSFEQYPWGRRSFRDLISQVKLVTAAKIFNQSYVVYGFVQVLQIWAYNYIPSVGRCLGNPLPFAVDRPKLLRFKGGFGNKRTETAFACESVVVTCMCDRFRREKHPTWRTEIDKDPKLIVSLIILSPTLPWLTYNGPLPKRN